MELNLEKLKELKEKIRKEAVVKLFCEPEDVPVKGNALASGDEAMDAEEENRIYSELGRGNEWAWCIAKVTATYQGIEESAYLGCCSYASEKDFRDSGEFDNMSDEALDRLFDRVKDLLNYLLS